MTWSVAYLGPEHDVVGVTYSDDVDRAQLEAAFEAALIEGHEHGTWHVLTDLSGLTGGHSLFDLYAVVEGVVGLGVQDRFREAVVTATGSEILANAQFWETACLNRGVSARVFSDRDAALAWVSQP
jgi:hypothetical protein